MKTKITKLLTLFLALTFVLTLFTACSKQTFEGVTLTDVTVTYDQTGHNVIVNGLDNYPDATCTLSEEKIDVGVYTQTLTLSQEGYEDLTLNATLTILKANPANLYPETTVNSYYNNGVVRAVWTGEPIVISAFTNYEQKPIAVIEYFENGAKLNGAPTEVGNYKVKIALPETNNYYALTKEFDFEIIQPQYTAKFVVINPTNNEEVYVGTKSYQRTASIEIPFSVVNYYEGYVFIGWFVENVEIHSVYDYNKNVTVVGKFVQE